MYKFVSDPGHGWLCVPLAELKALGIADKVSTCSYIDGANVWLEEDCDADLFVRTKAPDNPSAWVRENVSHTDVGRTRIRNLPHYQP